MKTGHLRDPFKTLVPEKGIEPSTFSLQVMKRVCLLVLIDIA